MKYITPVVLVALVLAVGFLFLKPSTSVTQLVGAAAGTEHSNFESFLGGLLYGGLVATSSQSSSITVAGTELGGWLNSSEVSYTPGLAAVTLTLPASSTIPFVVPRPGDRQSFCFRNATSTAGTVVTFAGGTGTTLRVASSSVSAVGSKVVRTGDVACFSFIRGAATATKYDIDVLMNSFE